MYVQTENFHHDTWLWLAAQCSSLTYAYSNHLIMTSPLLQTRRTCIASHMISNKGKKLMASPETWLPLNKQLIRTKTHNYIFITTIVLSYLSHELYIAKVKK